jgi:GDP-4-dehydro-6-deoxy-D-mannose reductase
MKVLVTGANGFVGRWLTVELANEGHDVVAAPPHAALDITQAGPVREWVAGERPDAIVHLAAVSFGPDARRDPEGTFSVNVLGTAVVLDAARRVPHPPIVLVTGSSEVYGSPDSSDLPLTEAAPTVPSSVYGLSKLAQEGVALAVARAAGVPIIVTRAFNHTGPGQRPDFVVPTLARRVVALKRGIEPIIRVGNVDVRRDFLDVRDVVRAYRLLIEEGAAGRLGGEGLVVNVASGRSVAIRSIIQRLCSMAGCQPRISIDESLVRADDPPDIRGDASLLGRLIVWAPRIPLDQTLADLLNEASSEPLIPDPPVAWPDSAVAR